MLLHYQLPILDARLFSDPASPSLEKPRWPWPTPGRSFVRCFGPVQRRRRGGHDVFPDEVFFASARGTIRFKRLEVERLASAPTRAAYRRLFCNPPVARLELGLAIEVVDLAPAELVKAALDLLEVELVVQQFRKEPVELALWRIERVLADHYARVTSPVRAAESDLILAGEPILLIDYSGDEVDALPAGSRRVESDLVGGADLAFYWLEYRRRTMGLWFLRSDSVEATVARRLRIELMRLHAEHQILKYALTDLWSKGSFGYVRGTPGSDRFDRYLNDATSLLLKDDRGGFSQSALRGVLAAYSTIANPEEWRLIDQRLAQVRTQIRRKVGNYLSPQPGQPSSGPVQLEKGEVIHVFVSHSNRDGDYLRDDDLLGYLRGLERERFDFWHDERIQAGDLWDDAIRAEMERADIALILVSQMFLNSRYCQDVEVVEFLRLRRQRGLTIVPIILSPCDWQTYPWLAQTQFLPRNGTIETDFSASGPRKQFYLQILQQLRSTGERIRGARS